jgi:hypothetical protein
MKKYAWKWTYSTHRLYVFWKENHPNLCAFSTKLTSLQFYVNFINSSYSTKQFFFFRSNWVYFVFSYGSVIWIPWIGYPNEIIDFWRPDDGRNRTCFFQGDHTQKYCANVWWLGLVENMYMYCCPVIYVHLIARQIQILKRF